MERTIQNANLAFLTLEEKFEFSLTVKSGDTIDTIKCLLTEQDVFIYSQTNIYQKVYIDRLNVKEKEEMANVKSCLKEVDPSYAQDTP